MTDIATDKIINQINIWRKNYLYPLIPHLLTSKTSKNVIFLRGISGSGKTTVANALSQLLGPEMVVSLSADNYFMIDGVYKFKSQNLTDAHKDCVNSMELALQSSAIHYIIMDNTYTKLWQLSNAETVAKQYDANLHYIDINVPDKSHFHVCLKRQHHNVSENILLEQWTNWEENPKSKHIRMFVSDEELLLWSY